MRNISLQELAMVDGQGANERNVRWGDYQVPFTNFTVYGPYLTGKGCENLVKAASTTYCIGALAYVGYPVDTKGTAVNEKAFTLAVGSSLVVKLCEGLAQDVVRDIYANNGWAAE